MLPRRITFVLRLKSVNVAMGYSGDDPTNVACGQ